MVRVERGRVQGGAIVFSQPLELPEGTEVVVYMEPAAIGGQAADTADPDTFPTLPFFGMWAGREEFQDSAAWVQRQREQWQQRAARQD
jgi:hypothetical protein